MSAHRLGIVLFVCAVAAGCSKDDPPTATPAASASAAALSADVDAQLMKELQTIAANCELRPKMENLVCSKGENRRLVRAFMRNERDPIKALPTFAAALQSSDAKLQSAAASVLHMGLRSNLGQNAKPGAVPAAHAKALLDVLPKLSAPLAKQVVPTVVHAAMLAGQHDALYQTLDALKSPEVGPAAYRHAMTYGRLKAFPRIKQLSQQSHTPTVLAALESPRSMRDWSDEEEAALCPWASSFLKDNRPAVASKAAGLLGNCTGKYLDTLLDEGEHLLKDKQFSVVQVMAFRDLCAAHRRGGPSAASDAQCERNRKLLESVARTKEVPARARGMALSALAYQWPDDETLKLAKQLQDSDDNELKVSARQTIQRVERRQARRDTKRDSKPGKPGERRPPSLGHDAKPTSKPPTP